MNQLPSLLGLLIPGLLFNCVSATFGADPQVFSGPQVGEPLQEFTVRGVFDPSAGKDLNFVKDADARPLILIFVHDVNRQSISMVRILTRYTMTRQNDGLTTGVIWLNDDATQAEAELKRIRHALVPEAPVGVSLEGREGPGSYGLNRNVMLTILVAKDRQVTANYALIQPSLQVDLPKILQSVVDVVGGTVPALAELPEMRERMAPAASGSEELNLRPLLAPVIRRDATEEQVDQAAAAVDARAEADPRVRKEVGRIAKTIVHSDKLPNYGTARTQEHLRRWAETYGEVSP